MDRMGRCRHIGARFGHRRPAPGWGGSGGTVARPYIRVRGLLPPARPPGGGGGAPRAPRRSAWLRTRTATTATTATTRGSSSPWMPKIPSSMRTLRRPSYCRGVPAVPAAGPTAVGSACRPCCALRELPTDPRKSSRAHSRSVRTKPRSPRRAARSSGASPWL